MTNTLKPYSLSVVFWNANGLAPKRDELHEFVSRHNLDVILVQETFLKPDINPKIPNYRLYRNDRLTGRGGGTAIYVKSSIEHHLFYTPALQHIEATTVIINTSSAGPVKFVSAYNPPNKRILDTDLDSLLIDNIPTIIAGDLNSKHPNWNSRVTNTNGKILNSYIELNTNCIAAGPFTPTHFSHNRPDILDIAVLKDCPLTFSLDTLNDLSSDHNPVLMNLGHDHPDDSIPVSRSKISWPKFTEHLKNTLGPIPYINTIPELEDSVSALTTKIQTSLQFATSQFQTTAKTLNVPTHIMDLIREKRRARRRAQISLDPTDRTTANRLIQQVRSELRQLRESRWTDLVESLDTEDNSLWRLSKALRSAKSAPRPLHGRNGLVYSDTNKAEAFADHLEDQFSPNYQGIDINHVSNTHNFVRRALRCEPNTHIRHATFKEVADHIRHQKNRKAPGHDGITNRALKNLPRKAVAFLTAIINAILRLRHFPSEWKLAEVINIPKPGKDILFPQSFRPISLLPVLGKIAECIILCRLSEHTYEHEILPPEQFGFRRQHSTIDQAIRVVEHISQGFNHGRSTGAIFLDISKAFDKVWHTGLLAKMLKFNYPLPLILLIKSYLSQRKFRVKLFGTRSSVRQATAGVPQGSGIAPLLHNIYTADMPPTTFNVSRALYADDTAIYTTSTQPTIIVNRLQDEINRLEDWFTQSRIVVNPDKSAAVLFTRKRHTSSDTIRLNNSAIPWTNSIKYLGIILDRSLTWQPHITHAIQKANICTRYLYPLLNRRSAMSIELKVRLYKSIIRPAITYAAPVWATAATSHIDKLQRVQNRVLRMALNTPLYFRNTQLHRELQIPTIKDKILELSTNYFDKSKSHPNPLIHQALQNKLETP